MRTLRLLFLILGLGAGMRSAVAAAAPFRLFEVAVTRFVRDADGTGRVENGLLDGRGAFTLVRSNVSSFVDFVPAEWLGKTMIYTEAWTAYGDLGPEAVANYALGNDGKAVSIHGLVYYHVLASVNARLDVAPLVNLSTRGLIQHGGTSLIGGFVVEGKPGTVRRVLIRAIGPSLRAFSVEDAAANPYLVLRKGSLPLYFNDNWGERHDADEIERAAAQVGAFPLARASADAALLVELVPDNYTAEIIADDPNGGGTALIEIYIMP